MRGGSRERAKKVGATAVRLTFTEYLPLGGWLAMWATVALFVRPADAARLLAVTVMSRAIRDLFATDTALGMRRRWAAAAEVRRQSRQAALRVEAATLGAELVALALLVGFLILVDQPRAAFALSLLALAFPARHFSWANRGMRSQGLHRTAMAWGGVALVGGALLTGGGYERVAIAVALREWLALLLVSLPFARRRDRPVTPQREDPLTWAEVAGITGARARARLYYRVTKGIFSVFGPIGSVIARTGRGLGAHRKLDRYVPQSAPAAAALGLSLLCGTGVLLALWREPATLVLAGGVLRVAGAAGAAALWSRYAERGPLDEDEDEED